MKCLSLTPTLHQEQRPDGPDGGHCGSGHCREGLCGCGFGVACGARGRRTRSDLRAEHITFHFPPPTFVQEGEAFRSRYNRA